MKRIILTITAIAFACLRLSAQTTAEEYLNRYENQIKRVGTDGPGVETILDKWEKDFPEDIEMLVGRFNLNLARAISTQVVQKEAAKYLGNQPVMSLKDSLGNDVNYFQDNVYDDEYFAIASQAIDKAIKLAPERLDLRYCKVTSLLGYEKDSPDMALSTLSGLIDYNGTSHPAWKYGEESVDDDFFSSAVQEYCIALYNLETPNSFEAFRMLSEKMLKYDPKNNLFLTNIGTYYFVAKKDNKTALKYYQKVIKSDPQNYTAVKNTVLMARRDKNVKLEKKYLPLLVKCAETENERAAAQRRLDQINKK